MTRRFFVYPYAVWIIIFTVIPLLLIVYYSVQSADGGLLSNYKRVLEPIYLNVVWKSIWLAVQSTVMCFILGYPIGYILAGKDFDTRTFILFLVLVPMWMNFLLRTYAWLTILENNGLINTLLEFFGLEKRTLLYTDQAVILGMVYNFIPFMILPIYTVLKKMDTRIIEAAQDLGASPRKIFFRIVFPLSMPGVISGVTMVFMPAVTTFVISNLLGGGKVILIGNIIERQFLNVGDWGFASALSVVMMAIVLLSMGIFSLVDKDSDGEDQGGVLY